MEGAVWQDNSSGWKEHFIFLPRSPADSLTLHKCLMNVYWMNRQSSGGRVWPQDIGALLRAASSGPCGPGPGLSMLWSITEFMPRVCITGSSAGEVVRTDWSCQKGKQLVSVVSSERWLFNFIWSATVHWPQTQRFRPKWSGMGSPKFPSTLAENHYPTLTWRGSRQWGAFSGLSVWDLPPSRMCDTR